MKILLYTYLLLMSFSPKQGIEGFLRELKGNQMGKQKTALNAGHVLVSKIYIYKNLSNLDLEGLEGQWCKSVQQRPYKIIQTDNKGYYKIRLAPGKYFLLVQLEDGFFVPYFDQRNQPASINISSGKFERFNILVNSKAIY